MCVRRVPIVLVLIADAVLEIKIQIVMVWWIVLMSVLMMLTKHCGAIAVAVSLKQTAIWMELQIVLTSVHCMLVRYMLVFVDVRYQRLTAISMAHLIALICVEGWWTPYIMAWV
jgi:hypothetical protein